MALNPLNSSNLEQLALNWVKIGTDSIAITSWARWAVKEVLISRQVKRCSRRM